MDPTKLPPIQIAILAIPLYVVAGIALWRLATALQLVLTKVRTTLLRNEREAATDDHVHGVDAKGAPVHIPFDPARQGLVAQVEQLKDALDALAHEVKLHRIRLRLPDPNNEAEVLEHLADHVSTANWPAVKPRREHVEERSQDLPAPRPRPDGGYRGGGGPAE